MDEQLVAGEAIEAASKRSRPLEDRSFRYYCALGEAATAAADPERYYSDYQACDPCHCQGLRRQGDLRTSQYSVKLSALHPRYSRAQSVRVMNELLPRVNQLALLTKLYDIVLNIDAEEADQLELSLHLLEDLSIDEDLSAWNGLGFVVQAYGKRCPLVLDYVIGRARRSGRRMMVRLIKGAY